MAKPSEIHPISSLRRPYLNILLYAEPGIGKTPLITTSKKALILDADSGLDNPALANCGADVWTVEDHAALFAALEYLRHEEHGYEWVWLDSLTIFQEKGLEDVMADLVAQKPHRDIDLPDRGEYRLNYGRILRWVRHMVALPVNFGITAHAMVDEDYDLHVPLIAGHGKNGAMWSKVSGYMGIVGYLRQVTNKKGDKVWVLHTEQDFKDYYAKDRYGTIGKMVRPTIPKIQAAVMPPSAAKKKKTTRRRA